MGDLRRQVGAAARRPAARRTSAGRRSAARVSARVRRSAKRTRRCRSSGASAGWTSSWPLMPRWASSASPLSSGSQRYLPRRRAPVTTPALEHVRRSGGAAEVAAHRTGVEDLHRSTARPTTCAVEAAADDLDLGELGHVAGSLSRVSLSDRVGRSRRAASGARARCRRSRRPAARPPSWSGPRRGRRATRRPAPGR